ncbi:hypothetical protein IQ243_28560 [Nostocales cyanobacterium LEGE 11386]|nr:hypothetical protein [Nostocales cyanobacterium LEGE 11386]
MMLTPRFIGVLYSTRSATGNWVGFVRLEVIHPSENEADCLSNPADISIKTATAKFWLPNCQNVT